MAKKANRKVNWKVVSYSMIALVFLFLTFYVDWVFIIGAVFLSWLSQKEINAGLF